MKKIFSLTLNHPRLQQTLFFSGILKKRNLTFHRLLICFTGCIFLTIFSNKLYADVNLTTSTLAAGNVNQGTSNNIVYAVKMDVTTTAVTVNKIQFTLNGTFDANDLVTVSIYFNATTPTISGSFLLNNASAAFAAGHAYNISFSNVMAVGSSGYYIIAVNTSSSANDNNTIKINGATNPVVFGFTTSPNISNNQSDVAGTQTLQASDITLTTSTLAAGNINQGTSNNIVYAVQMSAATEPVTVNNIQFTLNGTFDANDLVTVSVYFNATTPTISGSFLLNNASAAFAAGHAYNISFSNVMAVGSSGYYIIAVNTSSSANDNNTIKINGATNPVVFGFTTSPNISNNQSDVAGTQTLQASDITLTTSTLAAGNINQGTSNNIVYAVQMSAATEPVTVSNIQFTMNGTFDANDLVTVSIYFNASTPTIAGSFLLNNASAAFAAGHTYNISFSNTMAVGSSGYYIIAVNTSSSATDNNTIKINGATNPIVFGFTTSPNITNNQSDVAGTQTIQASDITLATSTLPAGNINQGTNNDIVYVTQMSVATEPVTISSIQFTMNGTFDANDLVTVSIYFNASTPTVAGSFLLNNASAAFAAGHAYNISFSNAMAIGSSGYYIIAVNTSSSATDNNTIKIDGATNPVVFGFTTSPNVINNQSNVAGTQTIQASDITLTTSTLPAGNINQGTNNDIVYVTQMSVATEPVTISSIQFTMNGTFDANDLVTVSIYFNATTPTIAGSFLLNNASAAFAAGHAYNISFSNVMAIGSSGYYIIAVNTSSSATDNNTIKIDGATNPVVFGFTTAPNVINNQSNVAGTQTIQASDITLTTSPTFTNTFVPGTNNNIVYVTKMSVVTEPVTVSSIQFTMNGTFDANDLVTVSIYFNATTPTISGSFLLNNASAAFASGHAYNISFSNVMAIGSSGYYIIAVNTSPSATIGNTVLINGATDPVVFGYTTSPNITNNQTNNGGLHTLPVSFISIRAYEKSVGVNVEWKVANEINMDSYFVERSVDGRLFNSIGKIKASFGSSNIVTYNLPDMAPFAGNNFYRINAISKDGKTTYSPVAKLNLGKERKSISVYPNPVIKNGTLYLQFQNLEKDVYIVSIYNQHGQQVARQVITHGGGSSVQPIVLLKMAAGLYSIEVSNGDVRFVKKIIVE